LVPIKGGGIRYNPSCRLPMKIIKYLILSFFFTTTCFSSDFLTLINEMNFPNISQEILGHPYDSHGCFHFYPADIYILYSIVPDLAELQVKDYTSTPDVAVSELPWAIEVIKKTADIKYYKELLNNPSNASVVAYPGSEVWIIYNKKVPLFRMKALPGPSKAYYLSYTNPTSSEYTFDPSLSEATTPGKYYIFGRSDDFFTTSYRYTTIVPMWAKIQKTSGGYVYYRKNKAYPVPEIIRIDLEKNYAGRLIYNYFDIKRDASGKIVEAMWGSHDFGKYTIFWSRDKRNVSNEMGYATGEVSFEQKQFIMDLATALSVPSSNKLESFLNNFSGYHEYINLLYFLKGNDSFYLNNPVVTTYLRLMYNQNVTYKEWQGLPPYIRAAYKLYYFPKDYTLDSEEIYSLNKIGINSKDYRKIYGIERELYLYKIAADKLILKFAYLTKNWDYFKQIYSLGQTEFAKAHIDSLKTKEDVFYKILLKRNQFEQISINDLKP